MLTYADVADVSSFWAALLPIDMGKNGVELRRRYQNASPKLHSVTFSFEQD
jgi:hypothetical protein